jgi:hypothetical protein
MTVRMWATLPKDFERNALPSIEKALLADPDAEHVIIARVNRKRVTTDDDTHETIPTARIVHVEVATGELHDAALELLTDLFKARTNLDTLPFPDDE